MKARTILITLFLFTGALLPHFSYADVSGSGCVGPLCGGFTGGAVVGGGGGGGGSGGTRVTSGDSGKLVPCGTEVFISTETGDVCYIGECNVCDLQRMAMRIIDFLIWVGTIVAALLFVNAGVLYVFSPANPGNIARAHKIFLNTLVGLIIVLAAYMLIDVIMKTLYGEGDRTPFGVWNDLLCEGENRVHCFPKMEQITIKAEPAALSTQQQLDQDCLYEGAGGTYTCPDGSKWVRENGHWVATDPTTGRAIVNSQSDMRTLQNECIKRINAAGSSVSLSDCEFLGSYVIAGDTDGAHAFAQDLGLYSQLTPTYDKATIPSGIDVKSGACGGEGSCQVSNGLANRLTTFDSNLDSMGVKYRITEAWPPTRGHIAGCHSDGTCVDMNFTSANPSAREIADVISIAQRSGLRAVYEVKTEQERSSLVSQGVPDANVKALGDHISGPHFSVYMQ